MLEPKLYSHTRELLRERVKTVPIKEISKETNIHVRIIELIVADYKSIPKVDTVEKLYVYLTGKPLELRR